MVHIHGTDLFPVFHHLLELEEYSMVIRRWFSLFSSSALTVRFFHIYCKSTRSERGTELSASSFYLTVRYARVIKGCELVVSSGTMFRCGAPNDIRGGTSTKEESFQNPKELVKLANT